MRKILLFSFFFFVAVFPAIVFAQTPSSQQFFVDPGYHRFSRTTANATLRVTGVHSYIYVEDDYFNSLPSSARTQLSQDIQILSEEFDGVIYPRLTALFGSEWNPGIDNDPRITILFIQMVDSAGGYVNTNDEYPRTQISGSNEREIIYLNALYTGNPKMKSYLAHEFHHSINFYQKDKLRDAPEDVWLNEARSEYAPTYLGYDTPFSGSNLESRVSVFLNDPTDSLTEWRNGPKDYSQVSLFFQYLVEHYGGEALIREMMNSSLTGIASINDALQKTGYTKRFSDIYTDWIVAVLLNNCGTPPQNIYCYLNPNLNHGNLHITFSTISSGGSSIAQEDVLQDWSASWNEYTPGTGLTKNVLSLDFSTSYPNARFVVPYVVSKSTGEKEIRFITLDSSTPYQKGSAYVSGFGVDVSSVVVIPSSQSKMTRPDTFEELRPFYLRAELLSTSPVLAIPAYPDGSLLRARGDTRVYVITRGYKRWIRSPEIFNMYGHLRWEDIREVAKEDIDYYQESNLIRAADDQRVFELTSQNTKQWLRISGEQFSLSGRKWGAVFVVNDRERDFYANGADILN